MANKFLSRNSKENDEDDFLTKQLSALGDVDEEEPVKNNVTSIDSNRINSISEVVPIHEPVSAVKQSVFQQDLVITGNVTTSTSLIVHGTINGDVSCKGDITIDGTIKGNLKANEVKLLNGKITGDVECSNSVNMLKGSSIHGNISGKNISCDGKIEGNSNVSGKVEISENSVIIGDVICGQISIKDGAIFKGNIQTGNSESQQKIPQSAKPKEINIDPKQYI